MNSAETTAKLPASPLLSADPKATLTFSAEKDGSLRVLYQGWDDAKVSPQEGGGRGRREGGTSMRCGQIAAARKLLSDREHDADPGDCDRDGGERH